jgi:hypothetical protein
MRKKKTKAEKECNHKWIKLVAQVKKKMMPVPVFVCLKCGTLKVGVHTIRISRTRLDMGGKPIYNASTIHANSRLRIPSGTDMFD